MRRILLGVLLVIMLVVLPFAASMWLQAPVPVDEGMLPWRIEVDGSGTRVFGIRPGQSTLSEVVASLGPELEVAIIAAPQEAGSLEAYYERLNLGFVSARMILTVDAPESLISEMRQRAPRAEYMESATRKIALSSVDRERVGDLPVRAVSVIPSVNLDEATLVSRFGPPAERLVVSDKRVHLLYPQFGLDVVVDQEGRELFQYVAPDRFAALREPLVQSVVQR